MKYHATLWSIDAALFDDQWVWNDKYKLGEAVLDSNVWESNDKLVAWLIDNGWLEASTVDKIELADVGDSGVEVLVKNIPVLYIEVGA